MAIYILTFILGLFVDSLDSKKYRVVRNLFVFWLFVFLCFSYTNGSDWRSYELEYQSNFQKYADFGEDVGFVFLMRVIRMIISDFWLALGLLKVFYLWSCVKVIRLFTEKWISATTFLMPLSLLFMIIDNPLRFMVAMAFFNLAMFFVFKKKYFPATLSSLIALTCHVVSVICLPFLLLIRTDFFAKIKPIYLIAIYIILLVVSNQVERMQELQSFGGIVIASLFDREGMAEYYAIDTPESIFNLGDLMNITLFLLVVFFRKRIIRESGNNVFSLAILFFYVFIISHAIPLGHRMRVPVSLFVSCAYTYIVYSKHWAKFVIITLLLVSMTRMINNSYSYIPYTNSIPYILTEHKPYEERSNYNPNNYRQRKGHSIDNE